MSFVAPARPAVNFLRAPGAMAPGMRIGLLGGSFNPAHDGHLHVSEVALARLGLDRVWWLVSPQNPLKPSDGMADFRARISGAKKRAAHPDILVTGLEAELGTRYTVNTLRALKRRFAGVHFVWLMGSDNLLQIPRWRNWKEIFRLVPVAVVERPGSALSARFSTAALHFAPHRVATHDGFANRPPPAWTMIEARRNPISATRLRAEAAARSPQPAG